MIAAGISGRAGNAVFVATAQGTILRDRPIVRDDPSPAQQAVRDRLSQVSRAWRAMTPAQAQLWRNYALELGEPNAQNVFNRLGTKVLQVSPGGSLPLAPPTSPFPGDAVRVQVTGEPGAVRVQPLRANAPGVVTEILVQSLPSVHCRTYLSKYRTAQFVAFGAAAVSVPLRRGVWALATRFVDAATGQSTEILEVGLVVVE